MNLVMAVELVKERTADRQREADAHRWDRLSRRRLRAASRVAERHA